MKNNYTKPVSEVTSFKADSIIMVSTNNTTQTDIKAVEKNSYPDIFK